MKLGIIGLGVLGGSYYNGYKYMGLDVKGYDKFKDSDVNSVKELYDRDVIFVCLPTICNNDGSPNLTPFEDVLPELKDFNGWIFMRSTMMPGQTSGFNKKYGLDMIHCPEFLTESNANLDFFYPSRILVGLSRDISFQENEYFNYVLNELFGNFKCPLEIGTSLETELAKLASNNFLAMKVTFANEFDNICKTVGVDWERVKAMMIDSRYTTDHMVVTEKGGYGGMCFPKDTKQTIDFAKKNGYNADFLIEMDKSNDRFRK